MFKLLVVDDPHSQHFDKNKEVRRTIFAVNNLFVLGAGTQTCYDCGWVKLLFILLDQNLGLSHCIGYSSHHLSHQLGLVCEWSSLLPSSSALLVWVLWPPSQVLWGNTGRLHYTALHFYIQIVMIVVLVILGLYFLLNIYNLACLFLPGFGKLRRVMAAYKVII